MVANLGAGLTVGIVALALALAMAIAGAFAIAIAWSVKPEQAIFTEISAVLLISALGGSKGRSAGQPGQRQRAIGFQRWAAGAEPADRKPGPRIALRQRQVTSLRDHQVVEFAQWCLGLLQAAHETRRGLGRPQAGAELGGIAQSLDTPPQPVPGRVIEAVESISVAPDLALQCAQRLDQQPAKLSRFQACRVRRAHLRLALAEQVQPQPLGGLCAKQRSDVDNC